MEIAIRNGVLPNKILRYVASITVNGQECLEELMTEAGKIPRKWFLESGWKQPGHIVKKSPAMTWKTENVLKELVNLVKDIASKNVKNDI